MPTIHTELASRILRVPNFTQDMAELLTYQVGRKFNNGRLSTAEASRIKRLSESAIIMASSENHQHNRVAFEIATLLYENMAHSLPGLAGVTKIISTRLGNAPAVRLLNRQTPILPISLEVEAEALISANTININGHDLRLTSFQSTALRRLNEGQSLSLSAPTSAGKSFLIKHYIAAKFTTRDSFTAVVVVPTRALIRQLLADFQGVLAEYKTYFPDVKSVSTFTSSVEQEGEASDRRLFIVTQERLQAIMYNWSKPPLFDLLIVDESQKISDQKRGIVLEDTISDLVASQPSMQTVFLSPLASNPRFMLDLLATTQENTALHTSTSPVAQHVFAVRTSGGKSGKLKISKVDRDSELPIFDIVTNSPLPTRRAERTALVVKMLHNGASSIIYSSGPADAEKNALAIARDPDNPPVNTVEIREIVESLGEFIHEDYHLLECLTFGVGYHFGAMPDIARISVEDLFRSSSIKFIACTSTLLEGVNLPAKNIFIDKPNLGNAPMDDSSFWNLAGRAGRLMKDLSGNVFCINEHKWDKPVSERSKDYDIESSLNRTVKSEAFSQYCEKLVLETHSESNEQAVNSLVLRFLAHGESETRDFLEKRVGSMISNQLIAKVGAIRSQLSLPGEVLKKNRSIDVRLQETFANYLMQLPRARLLNYLPKQPFSPQFYDNLSEILQLCDMHFSVKDRGDRYRYFTVIAAQWIRELSLREMIRSTIDYKQHRDTAVDVNVVIRDLINSLNNEVRHHYVKFVKCFCDLLQFVLENLGIDFDSEPYTDFGLPNYLELGMFQPGTILLHNYGLSRTTSIEVNTVCRKAGILVENTLQWVSNNARSVGHQIKRPCRVELNRYFVI